MSSEYNLITHFSIDNVDVVFYLENTFFEKEIKFKPTMVHEHAWYELHYVEKGTLEVTKNGETISVSDGEMLFLPPRTYHSTRSLEGTVFNSFGFEISKNNNKSTENLYNTISKILENSNSLHTDDTKTVAEMSKELKKYFEKGGQITDCRVHNMLSLILFALTDVLPQKADNKTAVSFENLTHIEDKRHFVLDFLTSHELNNLSLNELSEKIYLSPKQINEIIKKRYNMTYKQKQIRYKIENAKRQIRSSNLPIDTIATQVGYTNLTSFYKAFKEIVGMSPSEYRKKPQ